MARQDVPLLYAAPDAPDAAFDETDPNQAERDVDRLRAEWQTADEAVARIGLDETCHRSMCGEMSLRWIYLHMVPEYAGHCGQADLLRERIDGRTRW
jgi:hypothetical protein